MATQLLLSVLESDQASAEVRRDLVREYADIGAAAGRIACSWVDDEFKTLCAQEDIDLVRLEALVGLAAYLVRRHAMAPAARLLLDTMLIDDRSPHRQRHPLRQVQDLVRKFHPALEPNESSRRVVAAEANRWIDSRATDPAAWVTYSAVCVELLSFKRDGSHMSPVSGRELILIETVLEPAEMQAVYDEVWPSILERLRDTPMAARRALVDVLSAWLRIGRGLDNPYGRAHDEDSIAKAADLARVLLDDLVPLTAGQPGLQAGCDECVALARHRGATTS